MLVGLLVFFRLRAMILFEPMSKGKEEYILAQEKKQVVKHFSEV